MDRALIKQDNFYLYLIVLLLEGYLTLSVEILAIRQLIPFVGNSVIATSLIIGFFLLALAFGYHQGGTYRKDFNKVLTRNFMISFYLLGIGLSYLFIVFFFHVFNISLGIHQFIVLSTYLVLIIAPLVFLLGQTVPLIMGLMHKVSHTASISGFVLNISTIGSFLGSIVTSLILLNYFGVAITIVINLFCLSLLIFIFNDSKEISFIILSASMAFMYIINVALEQQHFVTTNSYANYRIQEEPVSSIKQPGKYLLINQSSSSLITKQGKTFEYIEFMKKLLFKDLKLSNKNIVVLGAGGFTLSAEDELLQNLNNKITYVDIDTKIKQIILDNKYLPKINGDFVGQDARDYIKRHTNKFDVIISDAYTNQKSIPFHLLTKEYFMAVADALTIDGIAIFNIIGSPLFKDKYIRNINNTIRSTFANCTVSPLHFNQKTSNIIFVCSKPKQTEYVYTDNLNSAPLDMLAVP